MWYGSCVTQPAPYHRYTYLEYIALEEASNVKHEYFNGEIYAMAGGTPEHAALAMAIGSSLFVQLSGGPCRVYTSDLRIRVSASGMAAHPDLSVVCGELERDPENKSTATNPRLLVEVLSESTETYDRGEKLEQYKRIESLQAVLLVSQHSRRVELHERNGSTWQTRILGAGSKLTLPSIHAELDLDAIYAGAGL